MEVNGHGAIIASPAVSMSAETLGHGLCKVHAAGVSAFGIRTMGKGI
jgi:hypothetical protein